MRSHFPVFLMLVLPTLAPAQKPGAKAATADKSKSENADLVAAAREALARGEDPLAMTLLDRAIGIGLPDAIFLRGQMLEMGRGGPRSLPQALDLYKRGALLDHAECKFAYGRFLTSGLGGVPPDEAKARTLIKSAADKGVPDAQVTLAEWLEKGDGVEKNEITAVAFYKKAAEKKNPAALLALARFHDDGRGGLEKNAEKGTELCREAANLGSLEAANAMGERYQKGTGILQDNVAAIGWFNLAAQKGLAAAQFNLAYCYETGHGVVPDLEVAVSNYEAAAHQGVAKAYVMLGAMQERGATGPPNRVAAYIHYARAANLGHAEGAAKRDNLAKSLTPAQLASAEAALKP